MTGINRHRRTNSLLLLLVMIAMFTVRTQAQVLPDIPDIIRVTVDHADNGVLIQWEPSTDTDIMYYHLYRRIPGSTPTFTYLFGFQSHIHEWKHMTSGLKNLAYSVVAEDSTGTRSIFEDNVHRAVDLSCEFDLCSQSNLLTWTEYEGWGANISGYKIYGGISGDPLQELQFVQASTTTFTHENVDVGASYNYYIETINTSGMVSLSAIDTVVTIFPVAPAFVIIDHVTVVDQSTVELKFSADITGEVNSFRVLRRGNTDTPFTELETFWNVSESSLVFQDQVPTGTDSYQYLVQSLYQPEECDKSLVVSESNNGNNILLVNEIDGQVVHLSWTPYQTYEAGIAGYIIQRQENNGEFIDIATVGPLTTQWQENIGSAISGFQPGEVHYRVIAVGNPDGTGTQEESFSNITAAALETHLQAPNAITPGSNDINSEFKPLMDFAPRDYVMMVMDRGGRKMFETTDPGEGWDGRFNGGEFVNEGVYVFFIQYTDYTGLFRTLTGNLTVLYP